MVNSGDLSPSRVSRRSLKAWRVKPSGADVVGNPRSASHRGRATTAQFGELRTDAAMRATSTLNGFGTIASSALPGLASSELFFLLAAGRDGAGLIGAGNADTIKAGMRVTLTFAYYQLRRRLGS